MRTVVLVEGASDQCAVETLARRLRRDLVDEGVTVMPMGGATNIGHFVRHLGRDVRLAGLYDIGEEGVFRRALVSDDLESLGFFVCDKDLEDELIRALGADAVERVIAAQGQLGKLRTLQRQPAHRGEAIEATLRRFMGTTSGRKLQYARVLVEALALDRVPPPLSRLLERLGMYVRE
jgi:hypothetical protein